MTFKTTNLQVATCLVAVGAPYPQVGNEDTATGHITFILADPESEWRRKAGELNFGDTASDASHAPIACFFAALKFLRDDATHAAGRGSRQMSRGSLIFILQEHQWNHVLCLIDEKYVTARIKIGDERLETARHSNEPNRCGEDRSIHDGRRERCSASPPR